MGIGPLRASNHYLAPSRKFSAPKAPNPDPANFKIEALVEYDLYTVAVVKYPDCTNFEGKKVLVFEGRCGDAILRKRNLDPHFFTDSKLIARFRPTREGIRAMGRLVEGSVVRQLV